MSKSDPDAPKSLALIASKGSLDWAYPPFILASAAAAMGWDVKVFFTFYGLPLLLKEIDPEVKVLLSSGYSIHSPTGKQAITTMPQAVVLKIHLATRGFRHQTSSVPVRTKSNNRLSGEMISQISLDIQKKTVSIRHS